MEWGTVFSAGSQVGAISDLFRNMSFMLDSTIYSLIPVAFNMIYKLYDVSSIMDTSELLEVSSKSIYSFLAIFMFFRISFSLLGMLVDPSMMENKEKGAGKIVTNVFITIALIVAVPYLFSFAREAQTKIIEDQIIEKALYGSNYNEDGTYTIGNTLALSTWSVFLRPTTDYGSAVASYNTLFYSDTNTTGMVWEWDNLYSYINLTTTDDQFVNFMVKLLPGVNTLLYSMGLGLVRYQLSYIVLLSTAMGLVLLWTVIKLSIDVAYRSIKLFALELISPIAIISYIDPKSSKDGLFSKWLKEVVKTYISLFIRIFIFAFISLMLVELDLTQLEGGMILRLLYILAIIAFIKAGPKFIDGLFGTELSKEQDTQFATNLLKGLGFGVATAAEGGIAGGFVAKRTDGKVGKGILKGAFTGLTKGFETGNKTGFNLKGVIGNFAGTYADIKKEHGYEYNRDQARKKEKYKNLIGGLNNAKKNASYGWDENAVKRDLARQGFTGEALNREYNKKLENNEKGKQKDYEKWLRRERKLKSGTAYNFAYLSKSKDAREKWAKMMAVKAQEQYLADQGVVDQGYAKRSKVEAEKKLEADFASMIKTDVEDRLNKADTEKFETKQQQIRDKIKQISSISVDSTDPKAKAKAGRLKKHFEKRFEGTSTHFPTTEEEFNNYSVDDINKIYKEIVRADIIEDSRSTDMISKDYDGRTIENKNFEGFDDESWRVAQNNTEVDAKGATNAVEAGKKGPSGKRNQEQRSLFFEAKDENDADTNKTV